MLARVAKISNCKFSDNSNLKIVSPTQVLQRLSVALAGNISEKLLDEIRQIIYSLYRAQDFMWNF